MKTAANTHSAIGRVPALGRLSHDSIASGTAAIVTAANGMSCQRASNTEPSAAPAAIRTITASTMPNTNAEKDWVRPSRGPISSTRAGRERPDIKASAHRSGAAVAAASSDPQRSQPPYPKLSSVILSNAMPHRAPAIVAEMAIAIQEDNWGFQGLRLWLNQAVTKMQTAKIM